MPEKRPSTATGYTESSGIEWTPETGDTKTFQWDGAQAEIYAKFQALRSTAPFSKTIASLSYNTRDGRATLIERRIREVDGTVEEIYGVDMVRDITVAPYFTTTSPVLSDTDIIAVRNAVRDATASYTIPADWLATKKQEMFYLLACGETSYIATGFLYRSTRRAVKTKNVALSYAGINEVDSNGPSLSASSLKKIVAALPTGEWLKKSPQAVHIGKGRYDVTQEWHWAEKWSVVYKGSFGDFTA